jgi:hypothetical protein
VRAVLWFALLACLACLKWGYDLSQSYGLSPGDGGELRPLAERLAWGGFVALLGLLFAGGMLLYAQLYINRVWFDEPKQMLVFETLRAWGAGRFQTAVKDVMGSRYHAGALDTGKHTVNAPWYFIRLRGRRLPLILDGQGLLPQPTLAKRLLNL